MAVAELFFYSEYLMKEDFLKKWYFFYLYFERETQDLFGAMGLKWNKMYDVSQ